MYVIIGNILKPKGMLCNTNLNQIQIIKNWNDPYYLLDIFITSLHHRMMYTTAENLLHVISSTDITPIYLYKW